MGLRLAPLSEFQESLAFARRGRTDLCRAWRPCFPAGSRSEVSTVGEQLPEPAAGTPGAGDLGDSGQAAELEATLSWGCCASLGAGCRSHGSSDCLRGGQGRGQCGPAGLQKPASGPFADAWLQPPTCSGRRVPSRVQTRGLATCRGLVGRGDTSSLQVTVVCPTRRCGRSS